MSLKKYNPITPSLRHKVSIDKSSLWKGKPTKSLTVGKTKKGGRNHSGRITAFHIGGGHKQKYRIIDFKRSIRNIPGVVQSIQYDPNRSAFIALICYNNGIISYILAPHNLKVGDIIEAGSLVDIKIGNALAIEDIPVGTVIHNIEMKPGKGGQIARAAGTYATLIKKGNDGYSMIRLSSGEQRLVLSKNYATIGIVSNIDNNNIKLGKAGTSRWLGRKPTVRGVAMNPVDHPHGGGEGRTSGGRPSVTPWGKPTKGHRTRNNKRTNKYIVKRRYNK